MLIFLRQDRQEAGNGVRNRGRRTNHPVYHYTCSHYDKATGNCNNYADRPNMCRDFPYGDALRMTDCGGCFYRSCSRRGTSFVPDYVRPTLGSDEKESEEKKICSDVVSA
jgi:Fe-S-cluster containining protein